MITFEELGKLTTAREAALEKAKKESLEENQKAEIEARIDRAIKMTRLSNSETTQITIHFGNDYPGYLLAEVIEKYQAEGYFVVLETAGTNTNKDKWPNNIKYNVVINWDTLIHKQIVKDIELNKALKEALDYANGKEINNGYKEVKIITDEDDKASLDNYNWVDNFGADSWDRAIHFADMCYRGTDDEKMYMLESSGVVVIENVIDAFLFKIFGEENCHIANTFSTLINHELERLSPSFTEEEWEAYEEREEERLAEFEDEDEDTGSVSSTSEV